MPHTPKGVQNTQPRESGDGDDLAAIGLPGLRAAWHGARIPVPQETECPSA